MGVPGMPEKLEYLQGTMVPSFLDSNQQPATASEWRCMNCGHTTTLQSGSTFPLCPACPGRAGGQQSWAFVQAKSAF